MTELAQHFGVSQKAVHEWLAHFAEEEVSGLDGRSRAPHGRPRATPAPVVLQDWLPAGHLAYFLSDVVDHLDLSAIMSRYE